MTTQDPIDRTPSHPEESALQSVDTTIDEVAPPPGGDAPPLSAPPAGLPLAEDAESAENPSALMPLESPAPAPHRPSFLARHAVGILRTVSVFVVVVILLISWQGVAEGQGATESETEDSTATAKPAPEKGRRVAEAADSKFDMEKLENYIAELDRKKQEGRTGEDAPASGAGVVTKPEDAARAVPRPEGATEEEKPAPNVVIPPVQGPANHPSPPGSDLRPAPAPLSRIGSADLEWNDAFELALALQAEFAELQPVEISAVKSVLYEHLLEFSRLAGRSDNPLERMTALAELLENSLRLSVTDVSNTDTLLPASVLAEHRASPIGWCVIALALADRTRDLVLEPVLCSGELAVRYRNGAHRYLLSPRAPDRVLTDREFARLVSGDRVESELRILSRPEFWGHVLSEGGIDRMRAGAWARGMALIEKGLDLDPQQPRARVAQARGHLERQEEQRALECLDAAVSLDGTDRTARRARVELLLDLGRTDAAAEDLDFLARDGSDPLDTVRYARWWLERREYRRAHATLSTVLGAVHPEQVTHAARRLETEIAAAPWIEILEGKGDDRARLRAARRLGAFPLARAQDALVEALDDPNGHVASVALAVLRSTTGIAHLPKDADRWRMALAERRASEKQQPVPHR